MDDPPGTVNFERLDSLLDQAYSLAGDARAAFVEQLDEPVRTQVRRLLDVSHALTVGEIARHGGRLADSDIPTPADTAGDPDIEGKESVAGRWRLHGELGSGGMGQVFFATREATSPSDDDGTSDYVQEAAIKVLWSQQASSDVRARFLRERRILASLDHPGLARFIDGGFLADSRPWFAMEHIAGVNVDDYAAKISIEDRLRLFIEVCTSVGYAHQHLIVHRDIKPQNILVDQSGRARLLDFGIAGVLNEIDDGVRTQDSGTPLTLQYASPEQVTRQLVTAASDIYQLGLVLYKLLARAAPYEVGDQPLRQAISTICEQTPPPPSAHNDAIPSDLDAIVMTALRKEPDSRYRTATALAEDVARFLEGRPVHALPQTRWYVTTRFLRRHAVVAGIVAVSALALMAATVVSLHLANEAEQQASRSAVAQQVLSDVFQKADPFDGNGAAVTLAEALDRAQPDIAARVSSDPLLAWEVHYTLAGIYESLGLIDHEAAAYQSMLDAALALGESRGRRYLLAVAGVGNVLARTNPVEAVAYFAENLPPQPRSDGELDAWLSAQYSYVGALNRLREFDRSDVGLATLADVMNRFDVTDARKRGRLSQLQAAAARRAGDAQAEDEHWESAVTFMRQADAPSALAVTLSNRGINLARQGRYADSEAAFVEAMSIFEDAGLEDPTFATVMRTYAGLLFRTRRTDEAIATVERSLTLLGSTSQHYARFVGELDLAQYAFAKGDIDKALKTMMRSLPAAREAFADEPAVPRRMLKPFVKLLIFGRQRAAAAIALGQAPETCPTEGSLVSATESLEYAGDLDARGAIWSALDSLETKSRSSQLAAADVANFHRFYADTVPAFFDSLDQLRVLDRLAGLPGALDGEHAKRREMLAQQRRFAEKLLSESFPAESSELAEFFAATGTGDISCR